MGGSVGIHSVARRATGRRMQVELEYFRCNCLMQLGDASFQCLLFPHTGDIHKIMHHSGEIFTYDVIERKYWFS